jgi:Zn-finger nucleic acid-binding protein
MKRLRTPQQGEQRRRMDTVPDWEQPRHRSHPPDHGGWDRKYKKRGKYKKRKGLMRKFMEEAFDVIEDIFD